MYLRLWHRPYNSLTIWFDKTQLKRFSYGKGVDHKSFKGDRDPVYWWCFYGFCGKLILQSLPWQKSPTTRLPN